VKFFLKNGLATNNLCTPLAKINVFFYIPVLVKSLETIMGTLYTDRALRWADDETARSRAGTAGNPSSSKTKKMT